MRFADIRDQCIARLSVNDSQLNDDISAETWMNWINEAYSSCVLGLQAQAPREFLVESIDLEWPEGELTFNLPDYLRDATIYQIIQIDSNGTPCGEFPGYFETKNRMRVSPGYSTTPFLLRFYFIPAPDVWTGDDASIPFMIPEKFHYLIVWDTLILAKVLLDRGVPEQWLEMADKLRFLLHKEHLARPTAKRARIRLPDSPILRPNIN